MTDTTLQDETTENLAPWQRYLDNFISTVDWANDISEILDDAIASNDEKLQDYEIRDRVEEVLLNLYNGRTNLQRLYGVGSINQMVPKIMSFVVDDYLPEEARHQLETAVSKAKEIVTKSIEIFVSHIDEADFDKEIEIPKTRDLFEHPIFVKSGEVRFAGTETSQSPARLSPEDAIEKAHKALSKAQNELVRLKKLLVPNLPNSRVKPSHGSSNFSKDMHARSIIEPILKNLVEGYKALGVAVGEPDREPILGNLLLINDIRNKKVGLDAETKRAAIALEQKLVRVLEETHQLAIDHTALKTLTRETTLITDSYNSLSGKRREFGARGFASSRKW